ncbi:MAG TPA: hypothetical protein GXZ87_07540 [Bacteroidales bacterium]|nr:hypothetical protein [Bacteroidales bacterium]
MIFWNERTKELDRQIKAAGIVTPKRVKKNTWYRNFLAAMIWYGRFMSNPKNVELIMRMKLINNNFNF